MAIHKTLLYTPDAVIAELPTLDGETSNLPYMYFSLWHWARMVNGYSGFIRARTRTFTRTCSCSRTTQALMPCAGAE